MGACRLVTCDRVIGDNNPKIMYCLYVILGVVGDNPFPLILNDVPPGNIK